MDQTAAYFYNRVAEQFCKRTGVPYASIKRHVDQVIKWRKHLKKAEGSGHAPRNDDKVQIIDQWMEMIDVYQEQHGLPLSQKEKKKQHRQSHDHRRAALSQRMGVKKNPNTLGDTDSTSIGSSTNDGS